MKLNAAWHKTHPIPPRATLEERIHWHLEHSRHCACRPIPEKLRVEIRKKRKEPRTGRT